MHSTSSDPINWKSAKTWTVIGFPVAALLACSAAVWTGGFDPRFLWLTLAIYTLHFFGVTIGYHRLWAHRTFEAKAPLKYLLAITGAMGFQESVFRWAAEHRSHHKHDDKRPEQDPYGVQQGFWHAHVGWMMKNEFTKFDKRIVSDLLKDPVASWQHKNYLVLFLSFGVAMPVLIGAWMGSPLSGLSFGVLLPLALSHQATFMINSVLHHFGTRRYDPNSSARDNHLVSLLTLGEGYHNYHHRFPFDYRSGPRVFDFDPAKWFIWACEKVGLASTLRTARDVDILEARYEATPGTDAQIEAGLRELRSISKNSPRQATRRLERSIRDRIA
ncbi:MAG: fatty acid desaturase [Myxococcota bacterium]